MGNMDKSINWNDIKKAYITEDLSFNKLSDRYGVSKSTIRDRARREDWKAEKEAITLENALQQKEALKDELKSQSDKLARINDLILDRTIKNLSADDVSMVDIQRAAKVYCDLHDRDRKENPYEDFEDDGLLKALEACANGLFNDGDDSDMIIQDEE